jgi:hypothetical protein
MFYLDDFRLSENKYIYFSQISTPLLLVVLFYLFYLDIIYNFNSVLFMNDPNKNPNISIGAKVEIGKEAATEISKGISSVGSNVGLAGTVGAVTAGVAKTLTKSSLPPVQKAGIVIAGSLIGAGIHVGASAINKSTGSTTPTPTPPASGIASNISSDINSVSKLLPEYTESSALMDLILSINMITFACFSLIIILSMMILFKFFLNENKINLNLSSLIGGRASKFNNNLNYYLIKIIILNKKTSTVYIFIILFLLLVGLGFDCYFLNHLSINLDNLVNLHNNR